MNKTVQWTVAEQVHLVLCNCGTPEHQIIARYVPEDDEETVCLQVHLTYWENFWRRLWAGLRYALGYKSRYGEFDEICLNRIEARDFAEYLLGFANTGCESVTTTTGGEWTIFDDR